MGITIHWGSGSPFAWRAMLGAVIQGTPFTDRLLSFSDKDHRAPEYLALNPRGKVPTLVDGDVVVYESLAILAYLDRRFPARPLFGRTPREAGRIWQRVFEIDGYLATPAIDGARKIFRGTLDDDARAKLSGVRSEFDQAEAWIAEGGAVVGSDLTAADATLYPFVAFLRRVAPRVPDVAKALGIGDFGENFPHLARWAARIEALPGFQQTYPPHWR